LSSLLLALGSVPYFICLGFLVLFDGSGSTAVARSVSNPPPTPTATGRPLLVDLPSITRIALTHRQKLSVSQSRLTVGSLRSPPHQGHSYHRRHSPPFLPPPPFRPLFPRALVHFILLPKNKHACASLFFLAKRPSYSYEKPTCS